MINTFPLSLVALQLILETKKETKLTVIFDKRRIF